MTEPAFLKTTRAFYDTVASDYADHFRDALETMPLDRAILAGFADHVAALLDEAGLVMRARLLREPDEPAEKTRQAFLLARKPARA